MNIVLTGYMASGKTAVGTYLSKLCSREFVDTDALIEEKCGMNIPEIFKASGEDYFRFLESDVIKEVSKYDAKVIATGGGAVLRTENVARLRENGVVINLEPTEEVINKRLSGDDATRPLANGKSMDEILNRFKERKPYYDNCDVKIQVTAEKGIEELSEEILRILEEKYEGEFRSCRK